MRSIRAVASVCLLAMATLGANSSAAQALRASALPVCPSTNDTLSRLQPSDSAFAAAREVARRFEKAGLHVRCLTRSVMTGLAGVGKVAGLQTTEGTVTAFFVSPAEHFRRSERPGQAGYEFTCAKDGPYPARTTIRTNARRPSAFIEGEGEYFEVENDSLASAVRRAIRSQ